MNARTDDNAQLDRAIQDVLDEADVENLYDEIDDGSDDIQGEDIKRALRVVQREMAADPASEASEKAVQALAAEIESLRDVLSDLESWTDSLSDVVIDCRDVEAELRR